ncbi:MAG: CRISPR-associated protein Cas4 [Bacillota bacterium]|jgi:CRISPR-associated exonuclease Cas4
MYDEECLLPLSALAQYYYCPRRAALITIEQQWEENVYTAEGAVMHQRVHSEENESRVDLRIYRGVRVRSLTLGLIGTLDYLELKLLREDNSNGIKLEGVSGLWQPIPVEYKHGITREEIEYEVQLCAQAICLEEMLNIAIGEGYLYYGASRKRHLVQFDQCLRLLVQEGAAQLHEMAATMTTPPAQYGPKCSKCSMIDICQPHLTESKAKSYLNQILHELIGDKGEKAT